MTQSITMPSLAKPVKWVISESIRSDHATHLVVQQQGTEFTLLFFEVRTPLFSGTQEEQVAALQQLDHVEAICVSRIVISQENVALAISNFAQAFNTMVEQTTKGQENDVHST